MKEINHKRIFVMTVSIPILAVSGLALALSYTVFYWTLHFLFTHGGTDGEPL